MFKLIEKKYVADGVTTYVDSFGDVHLYPRWKEAIVVNKVAAALYSTIIVAIAVVTVLAMVVMGDTADVVAVPAPAETIPTVEAVPTVDTTPTVDAVPMVEEVAPIVAPEYVCDTVVESTEYKFLDDEFVWGDGVVRDINWGATLRKNIVMVWSIDNEQMYADFVQDIERFNVYTKAGVRVERYGYIAQENDFIVPVIMQDIEGAAWAHMETQISSQNVFGIDVTILKGAVLAFDPVFITEHWADTHTHTVLHEMGHMFGLGHTHDAAGEQTDSIMSYESDYSVDGYLPGDIAGLQQVFCNK